MKKKSLIKQNILQFIDNKGLSRYEFYKRTGITRGILDQNNGMSEDNTAKFLAYFPEVNPEWLLTGNGKMLKVTEDTSIEKIKLLNLQERSFSVPFYDIDITADTYAMNGLESASTINIGESLGDSDAAMRIYGNSMTPGYPSGCIIGIKLHTESFIEPGNVYVIETESNKYVKRLYYGKEKTHFICYSDNTMKHEAGPLTGQYFYPEFEVPVSEVRRIHGIVGVINRNKNRK